jgi:hypothetical protein
VTWFAKKHGGSYSGTTGVKETRDMGHLERTFAAEIRRSFEGIGFYFKIPDVPIFNDSPLRFGGPVKPFDAFALVKGQALALEYKVVRGRKSLPFSVLTEAQEKGLLEFEKAGGRSFVLVCYRGRREGDMRAFAVPIRRWVQLRETLGRNSLPYGFWSNGGVIELPRLSRGRWDIRRLLVAGPGGG